MVSRPRHNRDFPLSLSDSQLSVLTNTAKLLSPEQRHSFLLRVESSLKLTRQTIPSDVLFARCVRLALDRAAHD